MKVAILAGGKGTRLSEETTIRPKPMVEIGGMPILWHIMQHYRSYGHYEFVIALGYKGEVIKRYAADQCQLQGNLQIDLQQQKLESISKIQDKPWSIELIETGLETATGGRIKRLQPYVGDSTFMLTWGDGVANVDLRQLLAFHREHGKLVTVTAVRPPSRFGRLQLSENRVTKFEEKPELGEDWINGAFFVVEPKVFDYIEGDDTSWEKGPLEQLAAAGELMAYFHHGFWQCMDTIFDKQRLETLWETGQAPWKNWE